MLNNSCYTNIFTRLVKFPISGGIGPVSRLTPKSKTFRFCNLPIFFGIVPISKFSCKILFISSIHKQLKNNSRTLYEREAYNSCKLESWYSSGAMKPFKDCPDMLLQNQVTSRIGNFKLGTK